MWNLPKLGIFKNNQKLSFSRHSTHIILSVLGAQVGHFLCAYNFELFPVGHMDKASLLEE